MTQHKVWNILFLGAFILGGASSARAGGYPINDTLRYVQQIFEMISKYSQQAQETLVNKAKKEQIKIWEGAIEETPIQVSAYDYVKENLLTNPGEQSAPPQENLATAKAYVRERFLVPEGEQTDEKIAEIKGERKEYIQALSAELLSLSAGVRQRLPDDANLISEAEASGGGVLQDVKLNTATIKALARMTAVDIALQIKLAELEAAQELLYQPLEELKKPPECEGGCMGEVEVIRD